MAFSHNHCSLLNLFSVLPSLYFFLLCLASGDSLHLVLRRCAVHSFFFFFQHLLLGFLACPELVASFSQLCSFVQPSSDSLYVQRRCLPFLLCPPPSSRSSSDCWLAEALHWKAAVALAPHFPTPCGFARCGLAAVVVLRVCCV